MDLELQTSQGGSTRSVESYKLIKRNSSINTLVMNSLIALIDFYREVVPFLRLHHKCWYPGCDVTFN